MRIEYELKPEDWGAFGEYHARTSPPFRRLARAGVAWGVIVVLVLTAAVVQVSHSLAYAGLGVAVAILWAVYWPWRLVVNARKHMAAKDRPCLRGRHMMEAVIEGLHAKCEITDSITAWIGIYAIRETADHIFVMLDETRGYVVPKARVISGNVAELLTEINEFRRRAQNPS